MKKEKSQYDFGTDSNTVQQDSGHVFSKAFMPDRMAKTALTKTVDSLVIPTQSEYDFPVKINKFQESKTLICEPPKYLVKNEVAGGKCLGTLSGGKGLYRLMKPTLLPVFIKPNLTVAVVN